MAASLMGAKNIIAIDIFVHKLDLAEKFGATKLINANENKVLSEIMDITDGKGVDYAIEAAGSRDTMEIAFKSVHNGGGTCIIVGNVPSGE